MERPPSHEWMDPRRPRGGAAESRSPPPSATEGGGASISELSFSTAGRAALRATARGEVVGERKMASLPSADRSMMEDGAVLGGSEAEDGLDDRRQQRLNASSTFEGNMLLAGSSASLLSMAELSFSVVGLGARRAMGGGETVLQAVKLGEDPW